MNALNAGATVVCDVAKEETSEFNLSLALLPLLLLLLGKLAVGDRCGKTFPPARTSYYVLADVSKSPLLCPISLKNGV